MSELIEVERVVGKGGHRVSDALERSIAVYAALLPILRRLEANRQGVEQEPNTKHPN